MAPCRVLQFNTLSDIVHNNAMMRLTIHPKSDTATIYNLIFVAYKDKNRLNCWVVHTWPKRRQLQLKIYIKEKTITVLDIFIWDSFTPVRLHSMTEYQ